MQLVAFLSILGIVRNSSFDFQKILICSQMPTSMKITSWNIKILCHSTILKYDNVLAVCLGVFVHLFSRRLLSRQSMLNSVLLSSVNSSSVSLLNAGEDGTLYHFQETFPFFFGNRKIKPSCPYTALSFARLKSIRYSSGYYFYVLYINSHVNFGLSQLKGKPLIKCSSGTVRIKQCTFRELVKTSWLLL